MKCTDLIVQDHLALLRGLNILDGMIKTMEGGERIEVADAITTLKFLRRFGDEYHQTMEETVLFPLLLQAAPEEPRLRSALTEHDEERALAGKIDAALRSKSGPEFVRTSRQLSVLLRNHFSAEDALLADSAEVYLSSDQDCAIVLEFTKNRVQPEILLDFSRMESKYTPRPHETSVAARSAAARAHGAASYR